MIEFENSVKISNWCNTLKTKGKTIGFVPTMGALHEGHISLIHIAKAKMDFVVCSIFVNPTQFNDKKDFDKYPISLEEDIKKLKEAGCHAVFSPAIEEIYPGSMTSDIKVDLGYLATCMEAKYRAGHFEGVMQVVKRLLDIVMPTTLYLGRKDFQQYLVINKMVETYHLPVNVVQCPIIRETDGLAMSSRNMRLTLEERTAALLLSKCLFKIRDNWKAHSPLYFMEKYAKKLNSNPLIQVEYLEIVNSLTLKPIQEWSEADEAIVCLAAKVGEIRLIDNTTIC